MYLSAQHFIRRRRSNGRTRMLKYLGAGLADGAKAERKLHAMVKDSPVADWGKFSCFGEFRDLERKYISAEEIAALPDQPTPPSLRHP
jgi:hypothetical protein